MSGLFSLRILGGLGSPALEALSHGTWDSISCSPHCHTSPESQDGQRAVGLVAGVAAQPTAPEVMMPQVPEGRLCSEVLQERSRGHSEQRSHDPQSCVKALTMSSSSELRIPLCSISPTSPGPNHHHLSPRIQPGLRGAHCAL